MTAPNWGEFDSSRAAAPARAGLTDATAEVVLRAISSADGQALMAWLRSITIERRVAPGAPDAILRELEGQRFLVHSIEQAAEKGRQIIAERSKKPA
jgi:hypothetical protein